MKAMENIHIVFGHSAAAGLRETLLSVGIKEKIVNCWGDYQAGPVAGSLDERINWLCENYYGVGADDPELRDEYIKRNIEFVALSTNGSVQKTVWYGKLCANEYCSFLEFLHQADGEHGMIHTVDVCKALPEENTRMGLSTGSAPPEYLVKALPSRHSVSEAEYKSCTSLWRRLRNEDARLRVLTNDGIKSVEVSYFDEAMLDFITTDYQPAARVVGHALGKVDGRREYFQGNSDLFYFARLRELFQQGRIEWQGSHDNMREAAVRLAP